MLGRDGDALSWNGYAYVKNNPFKYVDPTGREEKLSNDVTDDFLKKLFTTGFSMWDYNNPADLLAASWLIPHSVTKRGLSLFLDKVPKDDIDKLPSHVLAELEKRPLKFRFFYEQVKPGGDWDFKIHNYPEGYADFQKEGLIVAGYNYRFDIPGNVIYGYAGAAGGFSADILKMLAGLGQKQVNASQDDWTWERSYYDDPLDQKAMQAGIDLWEKYGLDLDRKKVNEFMYDLRTRIFDGPRSVYFT